MFLFLVYEWVFARVLGVVEGTPVPARGADEVKVGSLIVASVNFSLVPGGI